MKSADLIARVEKGFKPDNRLDVEVELALFQPCDIWASAKANAAGTKVIYTDRSGERVTAWAPSHTEDRDATIAALRARASQEEHQSIPGGDR